MTTQEQRDLADQLAEAEITLKQQLIAVREAAGMTQADVSARLGWPVKDVAAFERLDSNPRLSQVRNYAFAVGARVRLAVTE